MAAMRARPQVREWRIPQVRRTPPKSVPEPLCEQHSTEQITQAPESEDPGARARTSTFTAQLAPGVVLRIK